MDRRRLLAGAASAVVLAFFCLLALPAFPQGPPQVGSVPIIAKSSKRTYRITGGGRTLINETTGVYMRDRNGSEYETEMPVSGLPAQISELATLTDRLSGKSYHLDFVSKTATVIQESIPAGDAGRAFYASLSKNRFLGKRTIAGIECEGYAVPHRGGGRSAELWVAPSLNYLLVDSTTFHEDEEFETILNHIETGREPDARFFHVPQDFRVVGRGH
jgi:hypothetical protein